MVGQEQEAIPSVIQKDADGILRADTFQAMRRLLAGEPAVFVFGAPLPNLHQSKLDPLTRETSNIKPIVRTLQTALCLDASIILGRGRVDSTQTRLPLDALMQEEQLGHVLDLTGKATRDASKAVGEAAERPIDHGYFLPIVVSLMGCMGNASEEVIKSIASRVKGGVVAIASLNESYRLLVTKFFEAHKRPPSVKEFAQLAKNSLAIVARPPAVDFVYLNVDNFVNRHGGWTIEYREANFVLSGESQKSRVGIKPEARTLVEEEYRKTRVRPEYEGIISESCPANTAGAITSQDGHATFRTESLLYAANLRTLQYLVGKRTASHIFP